MKRHIIIAVGVAVAILTGAGCESIVHRNHHRATSLYSYLYSDEESHVDQPCIPVLSLPLRVGVAFVPSDSSTRSSDAFDLAEESKIKLLNEISAQFKAYPFVGAIDVIPTAYLTPRGGFKNLDQLRTMYGVDVMALVSYDQVQFTDNTTWSTIGYSTVAGLLFVQGEKNETRTMLDAAVYDITSRKMLFRAPGISSVKDASTPLSETLNLRKNSEESYNRAATNLVASLHTALEQFKVRAKTEPEQYKVVAKPGYKFAAGALGPVDVLLVAVFGSASLWVRRQTKKA
jgi:rhombotail lipoprotein